MRFSTQTGTAWLRFLFVASAALLAVSPVKSQGQSTAAMSPDLQAARTAPATAM